jgi:hypothetical protein
MAGSRHHFIPRFLQKGFASHTSNKGVFTWVYRKALAPFNSNIINVGVEGNFYTKEQDSTLDDLITEAEGLFNTLIASLRADKPRSLTDINISRLIAHLETRTRHLRENFVQTGESLLSEMLDFVSDEDAFVEYMIRKIQDDPSFLRKALAEAFENQGIPSSLLDLAMHLSMPLVPTLMQNQRSGFSNLVAALRTIMPVILRESAKTGHIKALTSSIAPEPRVKRYQQLTYRLAHIDTPIILGDSIVLFEVEGNRKYKAWLDNNDVLIAVYLPVDSDKLLIGSINNKSISVPHDIREAIASCSLEYFIASEKSPSNEILSTQIGSNAMMLTRVEMDDSLKKAWS